MSLVREDVLKLKPYVPGKPIEEVEREYGVTNIIKLASNENPLGPSPKAVEAMKKALEKVELYPDGYCFKLRHAVSEYLNIGPDYLIFGNGSDEIIHYLGLAFLCEGNECIQGTPSFSQYEAASMLCGCNCNMVPLNGYDYDIDAMLAGVNEHTKLFFIANPNNPTGAIVTKKQVEHVLDRLPKECILVLDEAYYEYVNNPDYPEAIEWVREGRNLILLRTFSKIYALAGLRVGYGIAKPEIIRYLELVRAPFNVNSVAQVGAIESIKDSEQITRTRKLNKAGLNYFYQEFDRMGLKYAKSEANFVFVDVKKNSKEVFVEMLKKGVIIRTGDIFGLPTHIRVTTGTVEQNERFIKALTEVLT